MVIMRSLQVRYDEDDVDVLMEVIATNNNIHKQNMVYAAYWFIKMTVKTHNIQIESHEQEKFVEMDQC